MLYHVKASFDPPVVSNTIMESNMETTSPTQTNKEDLAGIIFVFLLFLWVLAVSLTIQLTTWFIAQFYNELGMTITAMSMVGIFASIGQGLLLGIPLTILAFIWPHERYKSIFQTWAMAAGYLLMLIPARIFSPIEGQMIAFWQLVMGIIYFSVVFRIIVVQRNRFDIKPLPQATNGILPALGLAAIFAYPWLAWGALGSLLDIVLNLLAGLIFGVVASAIIGHFWLRPLKDNSTSLSWDIFLGGIVIGTTLLIMSAGLGFNGTQLLLMIYLPALGWLIMAVSYIGQRYTPERNGIALALFIGLTASFSILFVDSDGMSIIASGFSNEILQWGLWMAWISLSMGWILGAIAGFNVSRLDSVQTTSSDSFMIAGVVGLWLIGYFIYAFIGQPGFYGDNLFVIFKDQADLSQAITIEDHHERREFVYTTLVEHANTTQSDIRTQLDNLGIDYTPYYLVNAIEVKSGVIIQNWLSNHAEVDRVLVSPMLRPLPVPVPVTQGMEAAPTEPQWNITNIGVDKVWAEFGIRGKGVIVGQSDSGVQFDHPELENSYRGQDGDHDYNWFDPRNVTTAPTDIGGHGTHTLGSILGETVGIAPEATWYACANLARNLGNPAYYLDCMQFMLAPFPIEGNPLMDGEPILGANVLNNSWGCPEIEGCDPTSLLHAVKALRVAGVFVVASAGNSGSSNCGSVSSPISLYDEVFSVGAINKYDNIAIFSSVGPATLDGISYVKPDILAPGVKILSSYPGDTYEFADGTSMSGPHVVGVVALIWSANPDLIGNIDRTEEILTQTAKPYNGISTPCGDIEEIPNNIAGYGIVDAYEAVKMALNR
ncbi:MAG: hypothetical protein B6242_11900 [Anaerolineaceae bacterium 4572_78]|nr:MAG: hypothetical protein B6242_11900 [Anaerolineaceae bacterium 4572_78]